MSEPTYEMKDWAAAHFAHDKEMREHEREAQVLAVLEAEKGRTRGGDICREHVRMAGVIVGVVAFVAVWVSGLLFQYHYSVAHASLERGMEQRGEYGHWLYPQRGVAK